MIGEGVVGTESVGGGVSIVIPGVGRVVTITSALVGGFVSTIAQVGGGVIILVGLSVVTAGDATGDLVGINVAEYELYTSIQNSSVYASCSSVILPSSGYTTICSLSPSQQPKSTPTGCSYAHIHAVVWNSIGNSSGKSPKAI